MIEELANSEATPEPGTPAIPAGLAQRVRSLQRRRQRRRAIGGLAALTLMIGALRLLHVDSAPTEATKVEPVSVVACNLLQLDVTGGRPHPTRRPTGADIDHAWELDRAAAALLVHAETLQVGFGDRVGARQQYREIVDLFPNSAISATAQTRLTTLEE